MDNDDPRKFGSAAWVNADGFASAKQGAKADRAVPPEREVNGHSMYEDIHLTAADLGLGQVDDVGVADMQLTIDQVENLRGILNRLVHGSITVNGHPLTEDVVLTSRDVGLGAVKNANPNQLHEYHEERFDHRYQYANDYLSQLVKHGSRVIFDDLHDGVTEEVREKLDVDHLDNTSDAVKFLRFTRRLDRRYVHQSDTTASAQVSLLGDVVEMQAQRIDELQSQLAKHVDSLSQLITVLAQDPTVSRPTKAIAREILAGLESEAG